MMKLMTKKMNSEIGADDHKAESLGEDSSKSQVAITTTSGLKQHDWELGGCCWNNMPPFCQSKLEGKKNIDDQVKKIGKD